MRHLRQLDGLRGIAALIVFGWHSMIFTRTMPYLLSATRLTPFGILFSGTSAVVFFFVLSGFVLNLTYARVRKYPHRWWAEFIGKRVFRIYPAYIVAILLAVMLKLVGTGEHSTFARAMLRDEYRAYWNEPFTFFEAVKTAAMGIPASRAHIFDAPIWSLLVEMRISIIFPAIIWVVNRRRSLTFDLLLVAATYFFCYIIAGKGGISTLLYMPQFVVGALLAKWWDQTLGARVRMPKRELATWATSLLLLSVTFCCFGAVVIAAEEGPGFAPIDLRPNYCGQQLIAIGSAGFIVLSMYSDAANAFLSSRPLQFMGRTSYSFYLLHMLVLLAVLRVWISAFGYASMFPVAIVALVTTYTLAYFMARFIEKPCNEFGRVVAARLRAVAVA
jgi:peptidoglycan/LPS O-acetylase OafA/YrhL